MTPAIAEALAKILDAIAEGWSVRDNRGVTDGYHIPWPAEARMEDAGTALAAALGYGESWDDVATALRALARPDVGLPEGWSVGEPAPCIYFTIYTANGPDSAWATLTHCRDGEAFWQFRGTTPLAVYAHLLRAAGVSNG